MSTMNFTKSLQIAMQMVTALFSGVNPQIKGNDVKYWDKGKELDLPLPCLRYFPFFEKIKLNGIQKGEIEFSGVSRIRPLKRKIIFYSYNDAIIATVWMEGNEFILDSSSPSFWRVVKIKYRGYYDYSSQHQDPQWFETSFTPEQTPLQ